MSFQINWELLNDGTEANQLKDFLNERFSSIERPNFLGPIVVQAFSFGSIPPEISVTNITDPMEEFYYEHDDIISDNQSLEERSDPFPFDDFPKDNGSISKNDTDAQLEITVVYKGDMSMSISTELIINQPTPAFMILPLTLTLTRSCFQGNLKNFAKMNSYCCDCLYRKHHQLLSPSTRRWRGNSEGILC
jgi:distribution and morphology protein 12